MVSLLVLMFTGDNTGDVHRTALFGALVFEAVEDADGVTQMTAGVDDPKPLGIIFGILSAQIFLILFAYQGLKRRRDRLISEMRASGASDVPAK